MRAYDMSRADIESIRSHTPDTQGSSPAARPLFGGVSPHARAVTRNLSSNTAYIHIEHMCSLDLRRVLGVLMEDFENLNRRSAIPVQELLLDTSSLPSLGIPRGEYLSAGEPGSTPGCDLLVDRSRSESAG